MQDFISSKVHFLSFSETFLTEWKLINTSKLRGGERENRRGGSEEGGSGKGDRGGGKEVGREGREGVITMSTGV